MIGIYLGYRIMHNDFFRFPHTPHLLWLGDAPPRDDKILSSAEVSSLLVDEVVVEEKLDGANLGLSLTSDRKIRAQNRGQYLLEPYTGQFTRLSSWLTLHREALHRALKPELILFGEWCAARHSLGYSALPDWFLLFDVYDRNSRQFWSSSRRNALACDIGLVTVPQVFHGKTALSALTQLVSATPSRYRAGKLEGIVVRHENTDWCNARAKLVRPDFTQAINTHWRNRTVEWNKIKYE